MARKNTEAVIRVGADGAEWLVWQSKSEILSSGRMTSSYSIQAALDQWLARATRQHMRPRRIWIIAGAAECAHRRISIPGTDLKTVSQAIPLAIEEDLPLPLSQMYWTFRTQIDEPNQATNVDVVATPINLYTQWEDALRERKIEIAGRIPEGPNLWLEMAAMRGSDIDLLTVWGERRATLIRGTEQGMSSLLAYVREPGEPWEALLTALRRLFASRDESKSILSIFTSDRLRKRILALPDLLPTSSENLLNEDLFLGVTDQLSIPVSLLAVRRLRLEGREPGILFGDAEERQRGELKRVAVGVDIPQQAVWVAVLLIVILSVWWATGRLKNRSMTALQSQVTLIQDQQTILDQHKESLSDLAKVRADWGSVWLEMSSKVPSKILFKDISYGLGSGIHIDGVAPNQDGVDELIKILRDTGYLKRVRIAKTEQADKQLSFQILADFDPAKVERFTPSGKPLPSTDSESSASPTSTAVNTPVPSPTPTTDESGKGQPNKKQRNLDKPRRNENSGLTPEERKKRNQERQRLKKEKEGTS